VDLKQRLDDALRRIVADDLGLDVPADELDEVLALVAPRDPSHGDLTCNAAMRLAKTAKRKPREIAEAICDRLSNDPEVMAGLAEIDVAGPGFINFRFAEGTLGALLEQVHTAGQEYGPDPAEAPRRVLIEFVSANPTGPLVVVGGRQAAVGDVIANVLAAVGHTVEREYYVNDSGTQMLLFGRSVLARYREACGQQASVPDDGYHGEYLIDVARAIRDEHGDRFLAMPEEEAVAALATMAAEMNIADIRRDLEAFGVTFDRWYSQKALEDGGAPQRLVERLKADGLAYDEDGAVWIRASRHGDDKDRVVVKSNGDFTYRTTDLAYHEDKFARGNDVLIDLWGPDHHGHVITMNAALEALGHPVESFRILIVQHCTLYAGGEKQTMSKRAGQVVLLRDLVADVGVDAARWFFVMRRTESHLDFDLELAKQQSPENPVYYVQYAHARIASIFAKARERCPWLGAGDFRDGRFSPPDVDLSPLTDRDQALINPLGAYPETVAAAAREYEPHRLTNYLYDLATGFHSWYTYGDRHPECRVITDDEPLTRARLYLVAAIQIVIANGLRLLGVTAPDTM